VRFLGRKVYLAALVTLLTAMRQGPSPRTVRELSALFGVDRRTLCRWRNWWQATFPQSDFWRRIAGRFMPPVDLMQLPHSLISLLSGETQGTQVLNLLRLLAPIDSGCF